MSARIYCDDHNCLGRYDFAESCGCEARTKQRKLAKWESANKELLRDWLFWQFGNMGIGFVQKTDKDKAHWTPKVIIRDHLKYYWELSDMAYKEDME